MTNLHLTQVQRSMIDVIDQRIMNSDPKPDVVKFIQTLTVSELRALREFIASFQHSDDSLGYVVVDDESNPDRIERFATIDNAIDAAMRDARGGARDQFVCALIPIKVARTTLTVQLEDPEPFHG